MLTYLFIILFSFISIADVPSNKEIINESVAVYVGSKVLQLEISEPVYVQSDHIPELMYDAIMSRLHILGIPLTENPEVATFRVDIRANPEHSWHQKSRNEATRTLLAHLSISIADNDQNIHLYEQKTLTHTDTVPHSSPEQTSKHGYFFEYQTVTKSEQQSFIRRIAEPLLLTVSVGTTVYLLYNVRSR